jgi:hypothetical protein
MEPDDSFSGFFVKSETDSGKKKKKKKLAEQEEG